MENNRGNSPLLLLAGALIGYGVATFASEKLRKAVVQKTKQLVKDTDWNGLSEKILGKDMDEMKNTATKVKEDVKDKVIERVKEV